jgi:hypothetical protein
MNMHAATANRNGESKDSLYEELQQVFDHFRTFHMQIMLGCSKTTFRREYKFKQSAGKDRIVCIHQTLMKK